LDPDQFAAQISTAKSLEERASLERLAAQRDNQRRPRIWVGGQALQRLSGTDCVITHLRAAVLVTHSDGVSDPFCDLARYGVRAHNRWRDENIGPTRVPTVWAMEDTKVS